MVKNLLKNKKIVCIGGGVGTSNLLRGLKKYDPKLTVITSMADDGGSSGRLRSAYGIMPPGDIVSCIAAMMPEVDKELADLLIYRLPGTPKDNKSLDGHKLGNLIMLAEIQRTGNFYKAIDVTKKLFRVTGDFLPATEKPISLSGITHDGRIIHSETTLDLAKYSEPHGLKKIYITPKKPKVNPRVISQILDADIIISGPGDLYTNQLPVLVIPEIANAVKKNSNRKIFILNVTNKPFETKDYKLSDFINAFEDHLGFFPFDTVLMNNNRTFVIPKKYKYEYIPPFNRENTYEYTYKVITKDLINEKFPIYHDSVKLATAINTIYNGHT